MKGHATGIVTEDDLYRSLFAPTEDQLLREGRGYRRSTLPWDCIPNSWLPTLRGLTAYPPLPSRWPDEWPTFAHGPCKHCGHSRRMERLRGSSPAYICPEGHITYL